MIDVSSMRRGRRREGRGRAAKEVLKGGVCIPVCIKVRSCMILCVTMTTW